MTLEQLKMHIEVLSEKYPAQTPVILGDGYMLKMVFRIQVLEPACIEEKISKYHFNKEDDMNIIVLTTGEVV